MIAGARRGYLDFAAKYPKSVFLAEARFSAALLADKLRERRTAAEEFLRYAADHPEPPFGDAAFFWAVRNLSLVGDLDRAKAAFNGIRIRGRAYYAAALELLEAMRRNKQSEAALAFYDALDTSACDDDERAGLKFLRANLLRECGRTGEALNELSALIKSHHRSRLVRMRRSSALSAPAPLA